MSSHAGRPASRRAGLLWCVFIAAAASPGAAQIGIDGKGWNGPPDQLKDAAAITAFSARFGIELDQIVPVVALPPLDVNALLAEDRVAAAAGDKVLRYGVSRPQMAFFGDGRIDMLPDGRRLWSLEVQGDLCMGLRFHFAEVDLPAGAELIVYGLDDRQVFGPYTERGLLGDGQFWSPHLWGARARIECLLPAFKPGAPEPPAPFVIDDIHHLYRNPLTGQIAGHGDLASRGECHNDVTCFPAWANEAASTAGIGFIGGTASLFCTGTLLNSQITDLTPYWLTANHCLSTNGDAQSSEIFWFFQTAACGGAPPALADVTRSAVCTLLATGTASDFTLLMIEGTIPRSQLWWSGWQAGGIAEGTASTGIHHPGGTFKRISFGTKSNALGCGGGDHLRVNWFDGPTEPGSSGSGIFDANHRLFGQLHCGPSGCGSVTNDQYGDLGSTYPNISGLLAAGSDDGLESNDSCGAPTVLGSTGFFAGLTVKSTDEDWYSFFVPSGQTLSINLAFTHAFGDIDLSLLNSCGGTQVAGSFGVSNTEAINFTNAGASGNFLLRVYLFSDTRNSYNLSWSTVAANNGCAGAQFISGDGTFAFNNTNAGTDGLNDPLCAAFGQSGITNDVWFCWTAPITGIATLSTCGLTSIDSKVAIYDGCTCVTGNGILACNDDACNTQSRLSWNTVANSRYLIRLGNFPGAVPGSGSFNITSVYPPPPNDNCGSALPLFPGDSVSARLTGATNDGSASCGSSAANRDAWYSFLAPADGLFTVTTCGTHDAGGTDSGMDTVVSLHSNCPASGGGQLDCNDDWPFSSAPGACTDADTGLLRDSAVSRSMSAGELVFIRVSHFSTLIGDGLFTLNAHFDPANDECSGASPVGPGQLVFGDLDGATSDGSSACGLSDGNPDLWYAFTAPAHGILLASTCGTHDAGGIDTGMDTVLTVHDNCPGTVGNLLACNDDWPSGSALAACGASDSGALRDSAVQVHMLSGQTVYIRVSHFGSVRRNGSFFLTIGFTLADNCADAVPIACGQTVTGSTVGYGSETLGLCGTSDGVGGGVWYRMVGTGASIELTTCRLATNYDSKIRVYTGSCAAPACVAGNDDDFSCPISLVHSRVAFDTVAGEMYNILVHGFSASAGSFEMTVACATPCPCEFDGSPGVNVFDLLAYLDLWFANAPGADLDATPGVNVFDLLFFLDCWFPASAGAPCP